jgi:putative transposase
MGKRSNSTGQHVWARGYDMSTVGGEASLIREYIRQQEREEKRLAQMGSW